MKHFIAALVLVLFTLSGYAASDSLVVTVSLANGTYVPDQFMPIDHHFWISVPLDTDKKYILDKVVISKKSNNGNDHYFNTVELERIIDLYKVFNDSLTDKNYNDIVSKLTAPGVSRNKKTIRKWQRQLDRTAEIAASHRYTAKLRLRAGLVASGLTKLKSKDGNAILDANSLTLKVGGGAPFSYNTKNAVLVHIFPLMQFLCSNYDLQLVIKSNTNISMDVYTNGRNGGSFSKVPWPKETEYVYANGGNPYILALIRDSVEKIKGGVDPGTIAEDSLNAMIAMLTSIDSFVNKDFYQEPDRKVTIDLFPLLNSYGDWAMPPYSSAGLRDTILAFFNSIHDGEILIDPMVNKVRSLKEPDTANADFIRLLTSKNPGGDDDATILKNLKAGSMVAAVTGIFILHKDTTMLDNLWVMAKSYYRVKQLISLEKYYFRPRFDSLDICLNKILDKMRRDNIRWDNMPGCVLCDTARFYAGLELHMVPIDSFFMTALLWGDIPLRLNGTNDQFMAYNTYDGLYHNLVQSINDLAMFRRLAVGDTASERLIESLINCLTVNATFWSRISAAQGKLYARLYSTYNYTYDFNSSTITPDLEGLVTARTQGKFSIRPDFGVGGYTDFGRGANRFGSIRSGGIHGFLPFFGFRFNLYPIDPKVPVNKIKMLNLPYWLWYHSSVNVSWSFIGISNGGSNVGNAFNNINFVLGYGLRINNYLNLSGGALFFKRFDTDPLLNDWHLAAVPYLAATIDFDVVQTFKDFISLIKP